MARRKVSAMALAAFLVAGLGALLAAMPVAQANDQCIQRCIQLENQCRRTSKGQGNCDAIAAQCMASCRQPK